jgi:hypothetical protein
VTRLVGVGPVDVDDGDGLVLDGLLQVVDADLRRLLVLVGRTGDQRRR